MTRVLRLVALVAAALTLGSATTAPASTPLPNVVVVMADDMPALDGRLLDFMPATKALMQQGVRFTDFHSETPLCCPARAGFLTGLHTLHHGVTKNGSTQFKPQMTIATQLHGVGYHTIITGKYLNNYDAEARSNKCVPGWDDFLVFGNPAYTYYPLYGNCSGTPVEQHGGTAADYSTDVIRERTLSFMRAAPAGQPLFAWVAVFAPHSPTTPAPRYTSSSACNSLPTWKPPDYNETDVSDKPAYVRARKPSPASGWKGVGTCRALLAVDDLVAALRDELQAEGRLSNTIFVFTGDNGMMSGEHRLTGKQAPYRTDIPFFMSWPDGFAPGTVSERVQNIDFAPTVCEIAGCVLGPYPTGQASPDGVSFAPLLLGTGPAPERDAVLEDLPYAVGTGVPQWFAAETTSHSTLGLWHYVEYNTGEKELYDVSGGPCWSWTAGSPGDPCELRNVANDPAYAGVRAALAARLAQLKS